MKIREALEKIEKETAPLEAQGFREEFDRYDGLLIYSLSNCGTAYEDLKETNKELLAMLNDKELRDDLQNLNKAGRYDRVLQDYLILKIRTLFDLDTRTLSFIQLAKLLLINNPEAGKRFIEDLKVIGDQHQETLDHLFLIANKVVTHAENVKLEEALNTDELLKMPILQIVHDLEELLMRTRSDF